MTSLPGVSNQAVGQSKVDKHITNLKKQDKMLLGTGLFLVAWAVYALVNKEYFATVVSLGIAALIFNAKSRHDRVRIDIENVQRALDQSVAPPQASLDGRKYQRIEKKE